MTIRAHRIASAERLAGALLKRTIRTVGGTVAFALCVGCGLNMQAHYSKMRGNMASHNYAAADEYVESQKQ
ncbi:MAG: hypothetical protein AAFY60_11095, partial [Myxococcota bacterium]